MQVQNLLFEHYSSDNNQSEESKRPSPGGRRYSNSVILSDGSNEDESVNSLYSSFKD
jgi:hypothetical protein